MPKLSVSSARNFRPLTVLATDASAGCRVGGEAPVGVIPARVAFATRYFGTFPLGDAGRELSIFTDLSNDPSAPTFIAEYLHVFYDEHVPLMQFVVHPISRRGPTSPLSARFDGHAVDVGDEIQEGEKTEDDYRWTHHKLGGTPFFYQHREYVLAIAAEMLNNGWQHALQMTSLGFADADVRGDWPFWNQVFHAFVRDEAAGFRFRYIWS
jgi:hypothetical protein